MAVTSIEIDGDAELQLKIIDRTSPTSAINGSQQRRATHRLTGHTNSAEGYTSARSIRNYQLLIINY